MISIPQGSLEEVLSSEKQTQQLSAGDDDTSIVTRSSTSPTSSAEDDASSSRARQFQPSPTRGRLLQVILRSKRLVVVLERNPYSFPVLMVMLTLLVPFLIVTAVKLFDNGFLIFLSGPLSFGVLLGFSYCEGHFFPDKSLHVSRTRVCVQESFIPCHRSYYSIRGVQSVFMAEVVARQTTTSDDEPPRYYHLDFVFSQDNESDLELGRLHTKRFLSHISLADARGIQSELSRFLSLPPYHRQLRRRGC